MMPIYVLALYLLSELNQESSVRPFTSMSWLEVSDYTLLRRHLNKKKIEYITLGSGGLVALYVTKDQASADEKILYADLLKSFGVDYDGIDSRGRLRHHFQTKTLTYNPPINWTELKNIKDLDMVEEKLEKHSKACRISKIEYSLRPWINKKGEITSIIEGVIEGKKNNKNWRFYIDENIN